MFLMPIDDPLANAPPDKARVRQEPQQIVLQHLRSVRNHDFGESDADNPLSGCLPVVNNDVFNLPTSWTHTLPECRGMSTFSTSESMDPGVYYSTPSMLDHSTSAGPEPLSPCFDHDALDIEGDQNEYREELLGLDGGTDTPSRSLGRSLQGLDFSFGSMPATFTFAATSPHLSPCIFSNYGPLPWQHMDGAATADVRYPPGSCPSHDCPVVGSSPTITSSSCSTMIKTHQEIISHVNHWVCMGINPSLLSMPIPRAEQLQERHYHAPPTGALSMGSGMQIPGYYNPDHAPLSSSLLALQPTTQDSSPSYPNHHPGPTRPRSLKSTDTPWNNVPSKKPATTKKRKQSTEKVHECLWPECSASFARTNNLKVHEQSKHLGLRPHKCPFAGCEKAEKGFSRKQDLNAHIQKRHAYAAEHGKMWSVQKQEQ